MTRSIWWLIVPALLVLIGLLGYGLTSNPRHIPSPLIGKPFPALTGTDLDGKPVTLGVVNGRPTVINVWASWCSGCRVEHPALLRAARRYRDDISLVAVNYKDERANARRWLNTLGNPYQWSYFDNTGRVGIELGVYGVPETFFVSTDGIIVKKVAAPISDEEFAEGVALIMKQGGSE